jgi:hypothetical protein
MESPLVDRILGFLRSVEVPIVERPIDGESLLPGVEIRAGKLIVDRQTLVWPGDLLHEAGHLAVLPAEVREGINGDLAHLDIPYAGEVEATAWAWAAGLAIGLEPSVLFHDGGYHGKSQRLIFTYSAGCWPGVAGLAAAGMTLLPREASLQGMASYPAMIRWLR